MDADAVAALKSLAGLAREGWDPEQLAENFAAEVRQVFLLQVAPEVADAVDSDRDRLIDGGVNSDFRAPFASWRPLGEPCVR